MRCPHCSGAVVAIDAWRDGCSVNRERGKAICTGWAIRRELAAKGLIATVRDNLLAPAAAAEFEKAFREALKHEALADADGPAQKAQRIKQLEGEVARLVNAIAAVGSSSAVLARLRTVTKSCWRRAA